MIRQCLVGVFVVVLASIVPLALAQDERRAEIEQRIQEVIERLELSDQQVEELTPIMRESLERTRSILESYGIEPGAGRGAGQKLGFRKARSLRKEMMSVQEDTQEALDGILTDDQKAELKVIQEERRAAVRARMREDS